MIALYLITLWAAAGLTGVYGQRLLTAAGYAPTFQAGAYVAAGVAAGYLTVQLLYMTLLKGLKPTKGASLYITEALSQTSAILLLPYLLNMSVPWPESFLDRVAFVAPALEKAEPLVFLGAFVAVHTLLKLPSFFASLAAEPCSRFRAVAWAVASGLCALAGYHCIEQWKDGLVAAMPVAEAESQVYRVGDTYANARPMAEGSVYQSPLESYDGQTLTLRFANPAVVEDERGPIERAYVTAYLDGNQRERYASSVRLQPDGWAELRIPSEKIPEGLFACTISWGSEKEPPWQRLSGFRPIVQTPRTLLAGGPEFHTERASTDAMNLIVLLVDGLAADTVSFLDYDRETTPSLTRLAASSITFGRAYTPAPETTGAAYSALTGLSPARHGVLGPEAETMPDTVTTVMEILKSERYVTAAFTEAEGDENAALAYGAGLERGFELFDPSYVTEAAAREDAEEGYAVSGSQVTLAKVRRFVDRHSDMKFMVFARLHELADVRMRERYLPGFVEEDEEPPPRDIHDSAVAYLDRLLGAFVKHIRDYDTRKNTCIVIASTYGIDFASDGDAKVGLTESSLRVPLIVFGPGLSKAYREDLVSLEDVAPALLALAGVDGPARLDGRSFLEGPTGREPVSIWPDPLALSIRSDRWRFLWLEGADGGSTTQLFDMQQRSARYRGRDVSARNGRVVNYFENIAQQYLAAYRGTRLPTAE